MSDTLDLLDEDEAKAAINASTLSAPMATRLATMVTSISRKFDKLCGPVVRRTVTAERYDGVAGPLLLRQTPVVSITSVSEWRGSTETALVSGDWYLDADGHFVRLYRQTSGYDTSWLTGVRTVSVTYVAGRYTTTAAVDAEWKEAASDVLRVQWQQESGRWAQTPNFPAPAAFDEIPGIVTAEEMIRRRMPLDLLPPTVA